MRAHTRNYRVPEGGAAHRRSWIPLVMRSASAHRETLVLGTPHISVRVLFKPQLIMAGHSRLPRFRVSAGPTIFYVNSISLGTSTALLSSPSIHPSIHPSIIRAIKGKIIFNTPHRRFCAIPYYSTVGSHISKMRCYTMSMVWASAGFLGPSSPYNRTMCRCWRHFEGSAKYLAQHCTSQRGR